MKFTNGFWQVRDGYTVLSPAEAYDAREHQGSLEVYAPVQRVVTRGHTLNTPQLTFTVTAVAPEVLKVRISHFQGGVAVQPEFVLAPPAKTASKVVVSEHEASISAGRLTARFSRGSGPWNFEFLGDGQPLTRSEPKGAALIQGPGGAVYMKEELSLDVG